MREFFDRYASAPGTEDVYFSRQRGRALLRFVRRHVRLAGPALDIGCGRGDLLLRLAAAGIACVGVDASAASVEEARRRLAAAGIPCTGAEGARRSLQGRVLEVRRVAGPLRDAFPPASFGAVFLIETLEHLPDAAAQALLDDARALLRPGGHLVATTPREEDLAAGEVVCPSCGGVFHRMQHVRSFTAAALRDLVASRGFAVRVCRPALLLPEWGAWWRARRAERARRPRCPECGTEFSPAGRPRWRRLFGRWRCLTHLVCIAAA